MKACRRNCLYRNGSINSYFYVYSCTYLERTGKSRLKEAYRLTGDKSLTDRVRELLEPENCPCYVPDGKKRRNRTAVEFSRREDVDPVKFRELHKLDYDDAELAKAFNVARTTVRAWRGKLGLPRNKSKGVFHYDWDLAREMYDNGATDREISDELGCSPRTVRDWRCRYGLFANLKKEDKE